MNELEQKKALRCLGCAFPRCESTCPTKNRIRDFIGEVKQGKMEAAAKVLYSTNPLPEFTSVLCDHARQCQGHCVRSLKGKAVAIPDIEFALSQEFGRPYKVGTPNGRKVALVGGGPANISSAFFLLEKGYAVSLFEKENKLGGAILTGIPSWRFAKNPIDRVESDLLSMGLDIHYGVEIGKNESLSALLQGFDRVILGVGAESGNSARLPKHNQIVLGLDFLHRINMENRVSYSEAKNPIIWGAGNVAMDCARSAKRLFGKATILYRRSRAEMPANAVEIDDAINEGVEIHYLTNITSPVFESGKLVAVNTIQMKLGELDASGRASFAEVPGSEGILPCDLLLPALGEKPDMVRIEESLVDRYDEIEPLPHVYLNGDCRYGAKNIASAITSGRELVQVIEDSFIQ